MMCDLRIHRNVFGMNEPFLFSVKRTGQPVVHLARLIKEFFGIQKGLGFLDKPYKLIESLIECTLFL